MYYLPVLPRGNRKIINTYYFNKVFDDRLCDRVLAKLNDHWDDSKIETGDSGPYKSNIRINKQQVIAPDPDGFPYSGIANIISEINTDSWNFDITGLNFLTDPPCIFKYENDGHFDWHRDFTHRQPTRKLGFTLQLSQSSEYEGGNLEFFGHDFEEKSRERGTLILFPSYIWHQVTPITKGTRESLVNWSVGYPFK